MDRETADDIKRHFDVVAGGLRSEIGAVDEKADQRFDELKRHFDVVAEGLRAEIQDVKRHSSVVGDGLRAELGAEIRDVKRHSNVVAESLRGEIRIVAEGVAGLDEKFTREFVKVREEIREQIGDVKGLLRASYGDRDRRVQALERKPS